MSSTELDSFIAIMLTFILYYIIIGASIYYVCNVKIMYSVDFFSKSLLFSARVLSNVVIVTSKFVPI